MPGEESDLQRKRAEIAEYVGPMAEAIPREGELSDVIQTAILAGILEADTEIDETLINQWHAMIFPNGTTS